MFERNQFLQDLSAWIGFILIVIPFLPILGFAMLGIVVIGLLVEKIESLVQSSPAVIIICPTLTHFTVQLGHSHSWGWLSKTDRLQSIQFEQNPYINGVPLPSNSAVFYGRERELQGTLAELRKPETPGNVSIIGERQIGKSSLLNQLYQALAAESQLVSIHTTTQNWNVDGQADFFTHLYQAIAEALTIPIGSPVMDYAHFQDFIRHYADTYRFVLLIDEFDRMTRNDYFDAVFFRNLRALGERPEYNFAYVLASYAPLCDICHQGDVQESKFWNIFGTRYILGLLAEPEAKQLIVEPWQQSLAADLPPLADLFYYSGHHPALIQLLASEYWKAVYYGWNIDTDSLQPMLREHYLDLWQNRSEAERQLLLKLAHHDNIPNNNITLIDLRQRGLVNSQNRLFAPFFKSILFDNEL
jgi:hypothetical protein